MTKNMTDDQIAREAKEAEAQRFHILKLTVNQFFAITKEFPTIDNHDLAFRMGMPLKAVAKLRQRMGNGQIRLSETNLDYRSRLLLGSWGINTLGKLFQKTDKDLLFIQGLGPKTLEKIKRAVREYMEAGNGSHN